MTLQSTLLSLVEQGRLIPVELTEGDERQRERLLFLNPALEEWLNGTLFHLPKPRGYRRHHYDQVEDFFDRFVGDPRFTGVGDFANIRPQAHGIYEMKTETVRIFGWFAVKRCFIAATADLKVNLKGGGYEQHRKATIAFRKALDLPQPDFVRGYGNVSSLL